MDIKKEKIMSGMMTLIILTRLAEGPSHGYALEAYLEDKLGRPIPPGTVYVLLSALKRRNLVSLNSREVVKGRQIAVYKINPEGIEFLKQHIEPLKMIRKISGELLRKVESL